MKFTIYRNLFAEQTTFQHGLSQNPIRTYTSNEHKWDVCLTNQTNRTPILQSPTKILNFLNLNNEFKKEPEIIVNKDGKPIDRTLAHLVGDAEIDGFSMTHLNTHLFATTIIHNQRYIIF